MQNQSNINPENIQEINRIAASAAKVLKQNPNAKIFVSMHDGKEWRILDAVNGVTYSIEEFKSRFGYAPPKPSQIPAKGQMVVVKKRQHKKGFMHL